MAHHLARGLLDTARHGAPRHLSRGTASTPGSAAFDVLPVTVDAMTTSALTARARDEQTTLHGIMSAVVLQALASEYGGVARLLCGSPVDLRRYLSPPIGDAVGFYVGMAQAAHTVDASVSPWDLARTIHHEIAKQIAGGVPILFHGLTWLGFRLDVKRHPTPAAFVAHVRRHPARPSSTLTNLGRLDVPDTYGGVRLTGLHLAVAPTPLSEFASAARGFAGRVHWNFSVDTAEIEPARARGLVASAVEHLQHAIDR